MLSDSSYIKEMLRALDYDRDDEARLQSLRYWLSDDSPLMRRLGAKIVKRHQGCKGWEWLDRI